MLNKSRINYQIIIYHRNICPENIYFDKYGYAKLGNFENAYGLDFKGQTLNIG